MKKYLIFIIILISMVNVNVKALEGKINPEWEKYMSLTSEEQSKYTVIPSQYIYEFVSRRYQNTL